MPSSADGGEIFAVRGRRCFWRESGKEGEAEERRAGQEKHCIADRGHRIKPWGRRLDKLPLAQEATG